MKFNDRNIFFTSNGILSILRDEIEPFMRRCLAPYIALISPILQHKKIKRYARNP